MGYDAACTLTTDGRSFNGTAFLEDKQLLFRGDTRIAIPLAAIDEVHAREGTLFVSFGERRAVLELGAAAAAKWAKRIAAPPSRVEKLGVKPGMRVAVVNLDERALVQDIESRGATLEKGTRARGLDLVFFGAASAADLARLSMLAGRIKPSGAIWVVRAKGRGAPISESQSMAAGKRAGLVDVKVVSFSDSHSAEKYVIPVASRASSAAARSRSATSVPGRE
jgi:hypothetical protein